MVETRSAEETMAVGRDLGGKLRLGDVLILEGQLGSGKTCFTKGVAQGLGLEDPGVVTSPTFVLMNSYPTRIPLRHYDLYRVRGEDLQALGFWDLRDSSVSVVEWGEKIEPSLLGAHFHLTFEIIGETARKLEIRAVGKSADRLNLLQGPPFGQGEG